MCGGRLLPVVLEGSHIDHRESSLNHGLTLEPESCTLHLMPSGHRPPIPPGVARVAITGTYMGHKWAQVFYLQLTGTGITAADLSTLATDIATDWNTNMAGHCTSSVSLTGVQIVYVPSVGNEVSASVSVTHTGTAAGGDINDASACAVINWTISAYYRGGHPRLYFPGVPTTSVTNGSLISGASQSAYASAAVAWIAAMNARTTTNISGVVMGTLSFASGNAWRATPLFRVFTGASCRSILGSQRRRLKS